HPPTLDLQGTRFIQVRLSCDLGVVAHNVESAVRSDVHDSGVDEAGESGGTSVRPASHVEGVARIETQRALVHHTRCVENIAAAVDEHSSRGRVKQPAPDVDVCGPIAPICSELAGVGEVTVDAEGARISKQTSERKIPAVDEAPTNLGVGR